MFSVVVSDEMLEKLRGMLEDEDEGTCVRLREYKVGGGWHAKLVLGLGMDEADEDEDVQTMIKDVPFVAEKDFLEKYGTAFLLEYDDNKQVCLKVAE